ncbi:MULTISPECIES: alpha/beta hydrolase [Actinoplanes]|uniref:alpha/beta fold hydrolase n=1 Tax=Actinoplanes TaxID=1865 RepID=UPI0012F7DB47|nr:MULTISPECIES: alpha/beta hydrolase [Actinoplanes]GLY00961.1 alpha/beta hydrolase [Actinoplanes sp. NBRC 101535]
MAKVDIRWRTFGDGGPKVVLLHGGLQTSANFTKLAGLLARDFTVHVPDRRGRGESGPAATGHGLRAEIDDLAALLGETGAGNVFGLSSGAVIALRTAMEIPVERLALYEPPLKHGGHDPLSWLSAYERELSRGHPAAAFATVVKGTGGARLVPRAALIPLAGLALRTGGGRELGELIPTMRLDAAVVEEAAGPLSTYDGVTAETLLLGGTRSPAYLKEVLTGLEPVLPRARRVTLTGVGHLAADNSGRPALVAAELRKFFR